MTIRPPILFVHGAHCDGRIWQHGFLQSIEQRGWRCIALDLPGHGARRQAGQNLELLGMADYQRAIRECVASCGAPPVLVGHSMGGYLLQAFALEGGPASALVLLASAPPQGMGRDALLFAMRHPLLSLATGFAARETAQRRARRVRAMLMTPRTPPETVLWVQGLLQRESRRALQELARGALPARPLPIPVLAIAGAQDQLVSLGSQRALAKAYHVPLHVQHDMAHMLAVEPGWQQVADLVAGFLDRHLPATASG